MFGASELHQYLPGLLPLYLEFAPACRYAGSATLSSETQSLRRVVNEDAMRNMLISEKRTGGGVNPSCQTHSRTELSSHKFSHHSRDEQTTQSSSEIRSHLQFRAQKE